ncbi:MAG: 50S ribosomal protein L6 [Candidatus Magasanikbacteria bacterium]|nr:50S ribosomal protein L6 [Candidatus Magasanikbacteria bacterium]
MSRIGKKPILIPENVEIKLEDEKIIIKGPKGELQKEFGPDIKIEIKEKEILVTPCKIISKKNKAYWGLSRAIIFNMIKGVVDGYEKRLQIEGIGYKARIEGDKLILQLGFSHPVEINQPEGIKFSVEKNIINVSGIDKELVGQIAAKIRSIRPPEPYKGKGIRYEGEVIRRKAGKKVVTTAG